MVYSNSILTNYCLKWDIEKKELILVECYYCIIYSLNFCQFIYMGESVQGSIFKHEEDLKSIFYIQNKESKDSKTTLFGNYNSTNVKKLSSFLSDDVDFSKELENIYSNSTISPDYAVSNILLDNLDYWSSSLTNLEGCSGAEINLKLKFELVIKSISIEWVNSPKSIVIYICQEININCVLLNKEKDFSSLRTYIDGIYQRARVIKFVMEFQKHQCICSIKKLSLLKNEIELRQDGDYKNDENDNLKIYTDNFLLTKIKNYVPHEFKLKTVIINFKKDMKNIENFMLDINRSYLAPNSTLFEEVNNMIGLYSNYIKKETNRLSSINTVENDLKNELKNSKSKVSKKIILNNNNTDVISNKDQDAKSEKYFKVKNDLESMKIFLKNFSNIQIMISNKFSNSTNELYELKKDLNYFMEDNSSKFSSLFTDKYVKQAIDSVGNVKKLYSLLQYTGRISDIQSYIQDLEQSFDWMHRQSSSSLQIRVDKVDNDYGIILKRKNKELKMYYLNFQILMQSIKPAYFIFKEEYLKFPSEKISDINSVNLITNSFLDNFFTKFIVSFSYNNKNTLNFFIFKFISKDIFFYIKYTSSYLEIWKKKYSSSKILFTYSNCTSEFDKYDYLDKFKKVFYMYVKVLDGKLTIMLRIDYNSIPEKISKYLKRLENPSPIDQQSLFEENENVFNEYYKNGKVIYEKNDIDLLIGGYFGIAGKNTRILMISRYPKQKTENKISYSLSALNTRYPFNYFPDVFNFKKTPVDEAIRDFLSLDHTWISYDTEFHALMNFYFKFEVNFDRIYGPAILQEKNNEYNQSSETQEETQHSVYLRLDSTNIEISYFFEIVKIENGFIFKWFFMNKISNRKINIFRRRIDCPIKHLSRTGVKNKYMFIFVKNKESMVLNIKYKSRSVFKNVFSLRNFNFVKILFILNSKNYGSVDSIYLSDTFGGSFMKENKSEKYQQLILTDRLNSCTNEKFLNYRCIVRDTNVCKSLFCKNCCSKKLLMIAEGTYRLCFEKCSKNLKK